MADGVLNATVRDDRARVCPSPTCVDPLHLLPRDSLAALDPGTHAGVVDRAVRRLTIGLGQLSSDEIDILNDDEFGSDRVFEVLTILHQEIDELRTSVHELLRSHPGAQHLPHVEESNEE